ncbi:uncharacterized protein YejL (UPF0352 family) [Variovorax boronicumulans]|nr:uncharacterized protein YejL (UPF0352 family) [Variovorax boronicumulans]
MGNSFAIYPTRLGVYPFLDAMADDIHCEKVAPAHFLPATPLKNARWGLKVIANAFVYVYFQDASPPFWEYFHADDNGVFSRIQSVSENIEVTQSACKREAEHAANNRFIRISHHYKGTVAIGYSINWLTKEQRSSLLDNMDALMTVLDLDTLKSGGMPPQAEALAYRVESAKSFDNLFEHQNSLDGSYSSVADMPGETPVKLGSVGFDVFATYFSGKEYRFRARFNENLAVQMMKCSEYADGSSSTPLILGLLDPLGVAEELNHASSLCHANKAMWFSRNEHAFGSLAHYEEITKLGAKKAVADSRQYEKEHMDRVNQPMIVPANTMGQVPVGNLGEIFFEPFKPIELEMLDDNLVDGWQEKFEAIVSEHEKIEALLVPHLANHRNVIDLLARNSKERLYLLACEIFGRGDEDIVDNLTTVFVNGTCGLVHDEFWAGLVDDYAKGKENSIYKKRLSRYRRAVITGKEFTRDVSEAFFRQFLEAAATRRAKGAAPEIQAQVKERLMEEADDMVKVFSRHSNPAAYSLVLLNMVLNVWTMYESPNNDKNHPENFSNNLGRLFLTLLDARSVYEMTFVEGKLFAKESSVWKRITAINPKDVKLSFKSMLSSNAGAAIDISTSREAVNAMLEENKALPLTLKAYMRHTSKLKWIGTGLLAFGNVFFIIGAGKTAEQAWAHNDTQLGLSSRAMQGVLAVEVIRSVAARVALAGVAEGSVGAFVLGPWGAFILIVAFTGIFIWQQCTARSEIDLIELFLRRSFYGKHELDSRQDHFSRANIAFSMYPSLQAQNMGLVKLQFGIRATYTVDDEKANFNFKFANLKDTSKINIYYKSWRTGGKSKLMASYVYGWDIRYDSEGKTKRVRGLVCSFAETTYTRHSIFLHIRLITRGMAANAGASIRCAEHEDLLVIATDTTNDPCIFSIDYMPMPETCPDLVNTVFVNHRSEDDIKMWSDEDQTYGTV